ncbi:MAG: DNA alkylation repair protein [Clostridiales Family XIII bacterium]|jgi:3-methyladenine DNA glycosylase AlkD|nr:DNA alkylation repair protein [Clostridiales Family XIII bacterium]
MSGKPDIGIRQIIQLVDARLLELSEGNGEYASFNKKIVNTRKRLIGVRTPDMRRLAKSLAKGKFPMGSGGGLAGPMDAEAVAGFMGAMDAESYEHVFLAGLLINYAKLTDGERIGLAREYLKHADSWALIDLFAEKMRSYDRSLWWQFAVECLASREEYTVRYGVVVLMANYLDDEYIDRVFAELRKVAHDGYYVRMGMAWLYADAAVLFYEKTLGELERESLSLWTRRKALTKMLESYRFTPEQKEELRAKRAGLPKSKVS